MRLLLVVTFLSLNPLIRISLVSPIECLICRKTEASLVPGSMANSVFVFDSEHDDCDADTVRCGDEEQFCLAAWVELAPGHHWVQKGCISATAEGNGLGCTLEPLRLKQSSPLLAEITNREEASMVVCVCNNGDFCNAGSVRQTYENLALIVDNSSARFSTPVYVTLFWVLILTALLRWPLIA